MNVPATTALAISDTLLLKLAREIAMDIRPLEVILEGLEVDKDRWEYISEMPIFRGYLRSAIEDWQSATNTPERVRMKSLHFVEEALSEFYVRVHDAKEPLAAKTEVLKTIAKFAGVGVAADGAVAGERMVVTINLGADHQISFGRDVTPQVTEYEEDEE